MEAMRFWGMTLPGWRALDLHDRAKKIAHYRLHGAHTAQTSHVSREIAKELGKDGKKGAKEKLNSPVSIWTPGY